jgi:hypothetical protein
LLRRWELVAAEEEGASPWLSPRGGYPLEVIGFCLKQAGITIRGAADLVDQKNSGMVSGT